MYFNCFNWSNLAYVVQGLFLGSLGAAKNRDGLKSLNVTHILTVAHSITPDYPKDFVYKVIEGMDF